MKFNLIEDPRSDEKLNPYGNKDDTGILLHHSIPMEREERPPVFIPWLKAQDVQDYPKTPLLSLACCYPSIIRMHQKKFMEVVPAFQVEADKTS